MHYNNIKQQDIFTEARKYLMAQAKTPDGCKATPDHSNTENAIHCVMLNIASEANPLSECLCVKSKWSQQVENESLKQSVMEL